MRVEGKLVRWDDAKGFGFIEPRQGGEPVFVHIKSFRVAGRRPVLGDVVTFEVEVGPRGKRAEEVEPVGIRRASPQSQSERPAGWGVFSLGALVALAAAYVVVWKFWGIAHEWALYYLALTFVTAIVYSRDKGAARRGDWRTSEQTLHILGLLGGWPGGLLAQKALRHKSSKTSFQVVFWICVVLNLAAFLALTHPKYRGIVPWSAS